MNISLLVQFAIERTPDKWAIVEENKRLTYKQWGCRIKDIAHVLSGLGISKGDRVILCMENSEEHVSSFFALQLLGAVAVPINFRSKKEGILYYIRDSGAKMLLTSDLIVDKIESLSQNFDGSIILINTGNKRLPRFFNLEQLLVETTGIQTVFPEIDGKDLSCILYTSGTTGDPKGIPISHENSVCRMIGHALNAGQLHMNDEKVIGLMPLFHTVGLHSVLLPAILFNHTYYPVAQFDPAQTLRLIEEERITFMYGSPTHFQMLLRSDNFTPGRMASVRQIIYAGAPMSTSLTKECAEKICKNITLIYGNTETYNSLFFRHSWEKPGKARCGVFHNIRVVKIGGSPDEIVKPGEEGELIIDMRSPESFQAYLNKPDQTAKKVKNGWYYTGDACWVSEEGLYMITGRVDDMIISGGENIHPGEVEDMILSHPWVKDAAVVGIPDERWGQMVKAFVVRNDSRLTEQELDLYLKNSPLDNYKRPRSIELIDEIPRNPSGKILRASLIDKETQ